MGMLVGTLVDWLNRNFERDDGIWIDEGGLQLQGDTTKFGDVQRLYNEVGGEPEENDDDDDEEGIDDQARSSWSGD